MGALIIRIGLWGPLYYNYNQEPPQNSILVIIKAPILNPLCLPYRSLKETLKDPFKGSIKAPLVLPKPGAMTGEIPCLRFGISARRSLSGRRVYKGLYRVP